MDNPDVLYKRGNAYFAAKEYKNAIEDFDKFLIHESDNKKDAYFCRGMCKIILFGPEKSDACEDLVKAKELGLEADWNGLKNICGDF